MNDPTFALPLAKSLPRMSAWPLNARRAKPDISPFAGYKRVGNDNTVLVGVNIPLKVRDRNEAEIARAEADIKTAQVRLQLARNHALAEVEAAYAALQTSRELVETFPERTAPASRRVTKHHPGCL